jgi:hypothetical protein
VPAWLRGALVATTLLGTMESAWAENAGETTQENQKKAEFIASFTRFIEWPERKFAQPNSPFIIGVYGSDQILALLRETLTGRQIKGRTVVVQYLRNEEDLRACHVLFISRTERDRLGPILSEVRRENVLTVGECENFLGQGGVINFHTSAGAVRFQISMAAAGREKLTVSSKLLQLAVPDRVRPIFAR